MTSQRRTGFTLVEILIVVVILGILAAIVIPQFTNASETAKVSSVTSQLQTIRSQLELFQVQHNGKYPDLSDATSPWGPLTAESSPDHVKGADSDGGDLGPYLQAAPVNPFTGSTTIGTAATDGWDYDSATGAIKAIYPGTDAEAQAQGLDTTSDVTTAGS